MLRRIGLTITILAVLVLILALQLKESDTTLMRLLNPRTAPLHLHRQARRAFTPIAAQASTFSTAASRMASNSNSEEVSRSAPVGDSSEFVSEDGTPLGLPAPPSEGEAIKLDMSTGGDTVKLDSLGPMLVNKDGSISRIGNWDMMTEMERKNTLRIVGKRNKQRMDALKAKEDVVEENKA